MTTPDLIIPEMPQNNAVTTQEYVYLRLKNAIMLGALRPGTSLTMRGLADSLGLSPTPVREALRRLNSDMAVVVLGNRRMMIPTMEAHRFEELAALRTTLETHAATQALPHISDIIIGKMVEIDTEMDSQLGRRNLDQLTLLNQDFHRQLYLANPHQVTLPAIESVWLRLGPFQRQVIETLNFAHHEDRHKEILAALKSRDKSALIAAITSDIEDSIITVGRHLLATQDATSSALLKDAGKT
ncbi:GntR family transcriptional regulator [Yoonia sp. MH D7]